MKGRKAVAGHRFATLNRFVDVRLQELVPKGLAAPLLWFVLFRHSFENKVRRSVKRLSRETKLNPRTVRAAIQTLIDAELIWIEEEGVVPVYRMAHATKEETGP